MKLKKSKEIIVTNYYISDLHFGHQNIMTFDKRPFDSIEESDKAIIENWNRVVDIDDDVYILGDISWYNSTKTIELMNQLNGNLHLIRGNHDNKILKNPKMRDLFVEITDYKEITYDEGCGIVLCHYPIHCFKNHYHSWIHLYGHVHTTWEADFVLKAKKEMIDIHNVPCRMYNVGCMCSHMNYTPRTLTEILAACE
jgi:calcineurin-like phosphoesterase family protein